MFGYRYGCAAVLFLLASLLPPAARGASFHPGGKSTRLTKTFSDLRTVNTRGLTKPKLDFTGGAAVLSTLLTFHYGEPATEKEVFDALAQAGGPGKERKRKGFSYSDMARFAKARGYDAESRRMDIESLVKRRNPVIVRITIYEYAHFALVRGVVGDRVVVADPAFGNYTMPAERFLSIWKDRIGLVIGGKKVQGPEKPLADQARLIRSDDLHNVIHPGVIYAVPALR